MLVHVWLQYHGAGQNLERVLSTIVPPANPDGQNLAGVHFLTIINKSPGTVGQ
jgi:hypothetical protein